MNAEAASPASSRTELDLRHKLTADQVMAMVDAGIIAEDDSIEFLRGELYPMAPQGPLHHSVYSWLHLLLSERCAPPLMVAGQGPLACGNDSLPEPDVMVLRNRSWLHERRHPRAEEAVLVIEIAATSQRRDRWKAGIYAEAGVPEYWLLDLPTGRLEVHRAPLRDEARYAEVRILNPENTIEIPSLQQSLTVRDLLP